MSINKKCFGLFVLFALTGTQLFAGSNPASTGLAFLKIGVGGRAVGMGEAFAAVANDASASYWNPAGLANLRHSEFMFTHNEWFQDIAHDFVAFAFQKGTNAFSLSFISNKIGGIERRVQPSEEPLGVIDARDFMIGASWARPVNKNLQWGLTLKYLYEKIYLESAYGVAADLGIIYRLPVCGLTFGTTIQNLGAMSEMKTESISLPALTRAGLAYQLPQRSFGTITMAADLLKVFEGTFHANMGVELTLKDLLALRAGYLTGYDDRGFQGGFGVVLKSYHFDYGYVPFSSDIGNSHRISFGIVF